MDNRHLPSRAAATVSSALEASQSPVDLDEFAVRFIRAKVRRLIERPGFTESDRQDLFQEFALDLIQRRRNYDPTSGTREAFVLVVCENRFATILKSRLAKKRSPCREAGSLNSAINGERIELGATIAESQQTRRTGHCRSRQEASELAQDVAIVLETMPHCMREVCERLKNSSKAAVARDLGMSQGSMYELLGRIRTHLEKAGLNNYLH